jgi:hypothetical protein
MNVVRIIPIGTNRMSETYGDCLRAPNPVPERRDIFGFSVPPDVAAGSTDPG